MASATNSARPAYFLTTPIFYPNGVPHIGHAYTAMVTDAIARFQRLDGFDVLFLTGTDEHGLKMQQTAIAEGLTPLQLADRNSARFRDMMTALNISYDDYIRTTEPRHERACQALWTAIEKNGDIYLDKYAGWYSVRQEGYFDESETVLGDDGIRREPLGSPVEWTEEESYFFRLSAYQDKLLDLYARVPDFVLPRERLNEVASFVKSGLQDISVSRTTFDWGIKVPGAPGHVMYVWMDALTNYITAAGYPDVESESFKRYWPANLHVTGKDIVRFHAVYWPAFLMSAGVAVPQRLFSHGFLLNRGEKMSKSVGNVVDPFAMADQYGVDQVRYFFMREVSFGQDGSYNHEAIVARTNADLANDLGNLAQRSLSMIAKQYEGVLPEPGDFSDNDKAILAQADGMIGLARTAMSTQQIHHWLNAVWAVVAEANRYFAGEAPWALAKTDPPRQRTVLYVTAEVIRQIAILPSRRCRNRRRSCSIVLAYPRTHATSRRWVARRASRRRRNCLRRWRFFRATSNLQRRERLKTMLVDSHCHLDFPDFADDLDAIVARAATAGIGRIVTISTRVKRLDELLAITARFPNVYCSVGTHPHHADEEDGIPAETADRTDEASKGRGFGRGGAGLLLPAWLARSTGARFSRAYRRRPRQPACRWWFIPATPTRTAAVSWKTKWQKDRFAPCCIATPAGGTWR